MKRGLCALALLLGGCGSYAEDLRKICHAQELSGADPASGFAGVAPWLVENLSTKKSKELLKRVAENGSAEELRAEAAANGVTPCPLLDPVTER